RMTTRMPSPYTRAHAEDFVARCGTQDRARDNTFAIELADEGLIGVVGLFTHAEGQVEMGYWIGRPYTRQGYMADAVQTLIRFAFKGLGLHRLEAACQPHNHASAALLTKCGFSECLRRLEKTLFLTIRDDTD
ncbi:GNAT family N-acetyltransferase, partial [Klebsiella sp. SWET4]|uniref:GNAT family N-acetyltransferase n=1 Tax=Klebsiella sp. SWET4 TaxID=2961620 RepID=UPI0020C90351